MSVQKFEEKHVSQARILAFEMAKLESDKTSMIDGSPSKVDPKKYQEIEQEIIRKEKMLRTLLLEASDLRHLKVEDVWWISEQLANKSSIQEYIKEKECLQYLAEQDIPFYLRFSDKQQLKENATTRLKVLEKEIKEEKVRPKKFYENLKELSQLKTESNVLDRLDKFEELFQNNSSLTEYLASSRILPMDIIAYAGSKAGAGISLKDMTKNRAYELNGVLMARLAQLKRQEAVQARDHEAQKRYQSEITKAVETIPQDDRDLLGIECQTAGDEKSREDKGAIATCPPKESNGGHATLSPPYEGDGYREEKGLSFYQEKYQKLLSESAEDAARVDQLRMLQARIHFLEAKKLSDKNIEGIRKIRLAEALLEEIDQPASLEMEDVLWAGDYLAAKLHVPGYLKGRELLRFVKSKNQEPYAAKAEKRLAELDEIRDAIDAKTSKIFYRDLNTLVKELKAGEAAIAARLKVIEDALNDKNPEKGLQLYSNFSVSPMKMIALAENQLDGAGIKVSPSVKENASALVDRACAMDANICLGKYKTSQEVSEKSKYLSAMRKAGVAIKNLALLDIETSLVLAESSEDSVSKWRYLSAKLSEMKEAKDSPFIWRFLRTAISLPKDVIGDDSLVIQQLLASYLGELQRGAEDNKKVRQYKSVYETLFRACEDNADFFDLDMSLMLAEHSVHLEASFKWRFLQRAIMLRDETSDSEGWLRIQPLILEYLNRLREDLPAFVHRSENQEKRAKYKLACEQVCEAYAEHMMQMDLETCLALVEHVEAPQLKWLYLAPNLSRFKESADEGLKWQFWRAAMLLGADAWGQENWLEIQALAWDFFVKLQRCLPTALASQEEQVLWREYKLAFGNMVHAYNLRDLGFEEGVILRAKALDAHVAWLNNLEAPEAKKAQHATQEIEETFQKMFEEVDSMASQSTPLSLQVALEEIDQQVTQSEQKALLAPPKVLPEEQILYSWISKASERKESAEKVTAKMLDQYHMLEARVAHLRGEKKRIEHALMSIRDPRHLKPAQVLWAGEMLTNTFNTKGRRFLDFLVTQKQEPYAFNAQKRLSEINWHHDARFSSLIQELMTGKEEIVIAKLKEFAALMKDSGAFEQYLAEPDSLFSALDIVTVAESKNGAGLSLSEATRELASDLMRALEANIAWHEWKKNTEDLSKERLYLNMLNAAKWVKNREFLRSEINHEFMQLKSGKAEQKTTSLLLSVKPTLKSESILLDAKNSSAHYLWAISAESSSESPRKKNENTAETEKLVQELKAGGEMAIFGKLMEMARLREDNSSMTSSPMKIVRAANRAGLNVSEGAKSMAQDLNNVKEVKARWQKYQETPVEEKEERQRRYFRLIELALVVKFIGLCGSEVTAEIARFSADEHLRKQFVQYKQSCIGVRELYVDKSMSGVRIDPASNLLTQSSRVRSLSVSFSSQGDQPVAALTS